VVLGGSFEGVVDFGAGPLAAVNPAGVVPSADLFVAKLAPTGAALWSRHFGSVGKQLLRVLRLDATGEIVLAGELRCELDLGGGKLRAPCEGYGPHDRFVAKLGPGGEHRWSRRLPAPEVKPWAPCNFPEPFALGLDGAGNIAFGGGCPGASFLVQFSAAGEALWQAPSLGLGSVSALVSDARGSLFVGEQQFGAIARWVPGASPLSCATSLECVLNGRCAEADGVCVAAADEGCRASIDCRKEGRCSSLGGRCAATQDDQCRAAACCRESGACRAREGACVPLTDADCAGSRDCPRYGACGYSAEEKACVARRDADCRGHDPCRRSGHCASDRHGGCMAKAARDCRMSEGCAQSGNCTLESEWCTPGSDADCRQSKVCREEGACTVALRRCVPPSARATR
jgi:hypothetical protein